MYDKDIVRSILSTMTQSCLDILFDGELSLVVFMQNSFMYAQSIIDRINPRYHTEPQCVYKQLRRMMVMTRPVIPTKDVRRYRFLSFPLCFTVRNKDIMPVFHDNRWALFGNIAESISFNMDDTSYFAVRRCSSIVNTHVLFEYQSPTTGTLHILPDGVTYNQSTHQFQATHTRVRLPFEFTFNHRLVCSHPIQKANYSVNMSIVDRVAAHHVYPCGQTCGSLYLSAKNDIILVSPSVHTLGHVVTESEWDRVVKKRCSILQLSPGTDPTIITLQIVSQIPNPHNYPSYIVVQDIDIPYWTTSMQNHTQSDTYILSYSDFLSTIIPPTHILVIDEAHKLHDQIITCDANHIVCISSVVYDHRESLFRLCGINDLPFRLEDPERDVCVYEKISAAPTPTIFMLEPTDSIRRMHQKLTHSIIQDSDIPAYDSLLRSCAGGGMLQHREMVGGVHVTARSTNDIRSFSKPGDPCMICLIQMSSTDNVIMLTCGHVMCAKCLEKLLASVESTVRCPACREPIGTTASRPWGDHHNHTISNDAYSFHVHTKQPAVDAYVRRFFKNYQDGQRLCIITALQEVALTYKDILERFGVPTDIYGFGTVDTPIRNRQVIICKIGAYDRTVHRHCTHILVADIYGKSVNISTILHSKRDITILLTKDCADVVLFKRWYRSE
jgi:hypothetical protein